MASFPKVLGKVVETALYVSTGTFSEKSFLRENPLILFIFGRYAKKIGPFPKTFSWVLSKPNSISPKEHFEANAFCRKIKFFSIVFGL